MSLNFKESEAFKKSLESLKAVCQRLSDECGYPEDYSIFNSGTTEEKLKKLKHYITSVYVKSTENL